MTTPVRTIRVWVTNRDDGRRQLRLRPTDTSDTLRTVVNDVFDIAPDQQILRYGGRILRNGQTLLDCGITNETSAVSYTHLTLPTIYSV